METGSKQFQAVRGSVITMVANNTSARLQPTARSLVQGSLVWNHHFAITKGHNVITLVLYFESLQFQSIHNKCSIVTFHRNMRSCICQTAVKHTTVNVVIFANSRKTQQAWIQKPAKIICDILYAHLGHVGVVYWPCVLMQMGNILENVWGLLCFYAAQLLVNVSWYDVNFVQYKNDKWASAKREFNNPRICFCAAKHEKLIPRN